MSQASYTTPSSPLTMTALKTFLDNALAALASIQRGDPAGISSPTEGMLCWDNTGTPDVLKRYTAAAGWVSLLTVNVSTGAVTISDLTLTKLATGFSAAGGTTSRTLTVDISRAISDLLVKDGSNLAIGSDADGDTYYRASGKLARRAKGTAGQVWTMNAEATAPIWSTIPANAAAGTPSLRKLGTGALDAMPGNTAIAPPDGSITAAKLGPGAVEIAKILPPSAGTTHIIARVHQDAGVGVAGILGGAYIMLPGVITVYVQISSATGAISVFHNGVGVGSLAGVGVGWNDYTMNLTVSVGDVLTFTSTSGVQFRYLQIRSGVLTPAAVPYHRPGYTHMW